MRLEEGKGVGKFSVYSGRTALDFVCLSVLNGWLELEGHVNPGAAALLCWLLWGC